MNEIKLNPGAQYDFVTNNYRHSAYMGGRGAGKTFALVVRGLRFAHQPVPEGLSPPVGCLLTDSFPHLKDIVYPAVYQVFDLAGMKQGRDWREVKNQADRKFILKNGAQILMRSLDDPNRVRGLNLAWFGIDEGREFPDDYAYKMLVGALRQPGYQHAGWVCSTPAGFDWQWKRFHPDSPGRKPNTGWFNAPTFDNSNHLPEEFLVDLQADYHGLFYQQEVLGEFVGAVGGAVWPMFNPKEHVATFEYDPNLPLYAGWDFGIGDAGVCMFAQIKWDKIKIYDGTEVEVPQLRLLDAIIMTDKTTKEWAQAFFRYCDKHFDGRLPDRQWGDPAGIARQTNGTSTIQALNNEGVFVVPAAKRPIDEGIIIVQNLMDRMDGFVISDKNETVARHVQTYRWKVDEEGNRLSKEPVHDDTSHTCSALRYLALGAIGLHPRRLMRPAEEQQRGTMGYVMEQLMAQQNEEVVMNAEPRRPISWHPDEPVGLDGLF